jgi:hypothetical protein
MNVAIKQLVAIETARVRPAAPGALLPGWLPDSRLLSQAGCL